MWCLCPPLTQSPNTRLCGDRSAAEQERVCRERGCCGNTCCKWGYSWLLDVLHDALRFMSASTWKLVRAFITLPQFPFSVKGSEMWGWKGIKKCGGAPIFWSIHESCLAWNVQRLLWNGILGNVSSVPYSFLDYGKKAALKFAISIMYLVKVIFAQIYKKDHIDYFCGLSVLNREHLTGRNKVVLQYNSIYWPAERRVKQDNLWSCV